MSDKELKKHLISKYRESENIAILCENDFNSSGELNASSYDELKERIKYNNKKEALTIFVPYKYEPSFMASLQETIAQELLYLSKEIKSLITVVILLFACSVIVYNLNKAYFINIGLLYEIFDVVFWVFQFALADMIFFDYPSKKRDTAKLLQLARANIRPQGNQ